MQMRKKIKNRVISKDGYTIPYALALMFLLFAFAAGLLLFAYYNYSNSYKRHEKMQTYVYAKNILNECEYSIMSGNMNQILTDTVNSVNSSDPNPGKYGKQYDFKIRLDESSPLVDQFNGEKIEVEMYVTYYPALSNGGLPRLLPPDSLPDPVSGGKLPQYVSIGDKMNIEYIIRKTEERTGNAMEYQFLAEYFCARDINQNTDGTYNGITPDITNMKWEPFKTTGQIYTSK